MTLQVARHCDLEQAITVFDSRPGWDQAVLGALAVPRQWVDAQSTGYMGALLDLVCPLSALSWSRAHLFVRLHK